MDDLVGSELVAKVSRPVVVAETAVVEVNIAVTA